MNYANLKVGDVSGEAEVYADLSYQVQPLDAKLLDLGLRYKWLVIRSRDAEGLGPVFWLVQSSRDQDGYLISPSNRRGQTSWSCRFTCSLPWSALEWIGGPNGVEAYPPDPIFEDDTPPEGLSRAEKFKRIVADACASNRHTTVDFALGSGPRDMLTARVYGNGKAVLSLLLKPDGAAVIGSPGFQPAAPTPEELTEASGSLALSVSRLVQAGLARR